MSFVIASSEPFADNLAPVSLKQEILLLETVRHIDVMITSEVAHEGMASVSQERVANTKIAITLC